MPRWLQTVDDNPNLQPSGCGTWVFLLLRSLRKLSSCSSTPQALWSLHQGFKMRNIVECISASFNLQALLPRVLEFVEIGR